MSEIPITVWQVDPAFTAHYSAMLERPDDWKQTTVDGSSPSDSTSYYVTGTPVSIDPYITEVVLVDGDGDGLISGDGGDSYRIGDQVFSIYSIYRGDAVVIDGVRFQTVTLYGSLPGAYGGAIAFPIDESGKIIPAFSGSLSKTFWSLDSEPYPIPINTLPCFTEGTLIATPTGPVAVESLQPGDLVLTVDGGVERVLWSTSKWVSPQEALRPEAVLPILIPAGVLGAERDLWLSPLHRVLCLDRHGKQVLVPVRHLQGLCGIAPPAPPPERLRYIHLLLPRHSLLWAEGVVCESFYTGPQAMRMLSAADRRQVLGLLPDLAEGPMRPARPLLDQRALVAQRLDPSLPLPLTPGLAEEKSLALPVV